MEQSMQIYILLIGMLLKYHVSCGAVNRAIWNNFGDRAWRVGMIQKQYN